jgi:hypothetical protein
MPVYCYIVFCYVLQHPTAKVQFLCIKYLIFIALLHIITKKALNEGFVIKIIYKSIYNI